MSEKNPPLVSVLISCYNHGEYVGQAIESVLNQTYTNIELIVVDNGSTDNSYEVITKYMACIHRFLHLDNNDLCRAGTFLCRNATGDYIACMTADDCWLPDKIEKQMKIFADNPKLRACFTWIHTVDEQLNIIQNASHNVFSQKNRTRYEWMERMLMLDNCFAYPSAVIERKCYCQNYEKNFYQLGDKYLWMRILLAYDVHVIEEPLVLMRWHPNAKVANTSAQSTESSIRTLNEDLIITEDIIERMDDDFFIKSFGRYMKQNDAVSHEQILCEKYFFLQLLAEKKKYLQPAVISFYYKHHIFPQGDTYTWENALEECYNYTYMDFQRYCAGHGIGLGALQYDYITELQKTIQKQRMHFDVLCEVVDSDLEIAERKQLYRTRIYQQLDERLKELVKNVQSYLEELLAFITDSSDQEVEEGIAKIIDNVCKSELIFEKLWNSFLCYDNDISEQKWNQSMQILKKGEVDAEIFCDEILPFIIKLNAILNQYIHCRN